MSHHDLRDARNASSTAPLVVAFLEALKGPPSARHRQIIAHGRSAVFVGRGEYTNGHIFKADV